MQQAILPSYIPKPARSSFTQVTLKPTMQLDSGFPKRENSLGLLKGRIGQ